VDRKSAAEKGIAEIRAKTPKGSFGATGKEKVTQLKRATGNRGGAREKLQAMFPTVGTVETY